MLNLEQQSPFNLKQIEIQGHPFERQVPDGNGNWTWQLVQREIISTPTGLTVTKQTENGEWQEVPLMATEIVHIPVNQQ